MEYPIDANGRHIKVGDLILYPIKGGRCGASIGQGTVKGIKQGNSTALGGAVVIKINILEHETGNIKVHQWPKKCIVIDSHILRGEGLHD